MRYRKILDMAYNQEEFYFLKFFEKFIKYLFISLIIFAILNLLVDIEILNNIETALMILMLIAYLHIGLPIFLILVLGVIIEFFFKTKS